MGPYIMQTLLCLVAPALFAASIYMTLGRIIRLVDGEHHSLIRLKWLTKIFVAGDIISFITQGAGTQCRRSCLFKSDSICRWRPPICWKQRSEYCQDRFERYRWRSRHSACHLCLLCHHGSSLPHANAVGTYSGII